MYRCNDFDGLTGWRKVAVLNTTLLASVTLLFTTVLITSVLRSGEFIRTIIIYNGGCNGGSTSRVSITLHLVINVFSTAVLGSSNYFIQVLNAPTRDEIDANHKRGSYLEIGVSSWRNAPRLSWFKTTACAFLCLSSIPIHFVFNSTIFEIDYRAANYDLTIASEGFVEGAPYFLPGASLAYGKAKGPLWDPARPDGPSDLLHKVSRASDDGARWAKLENDECMEYYVKGHGIQKYESVIVVVRGPFECWRADQTWNLTTGVTKQWEKSMPSSQPNSLWFSAHCNMTMNRERGGFVIYNSCYRALGVDSALDGYPSNRMNEWLIALLDNEPNHGIGDPDRYHTSVYPWPFDEHIYAWPCNLSQARGINIQLGRDHLDVEYCLAERKEGETNFNLLATTTAQVRSTHNAHYYHGSSDVEYISSLSGYGPVGFPDPHLPDDCVVGMRFSTSALGFVLIICLLLIIALAVTASRKFKGHMPLVGSNSAAISSACYVSTLSKVTSELYTPEKLAKDKATNLDSGIAHGRSNEERLEDDNLRRLPQCLLMWGIVQMPPEWYATEAPNEGEYTVAYLGFGTKLGDVQAPTEGSGYLFR
ncbi:hypothetical protein NUW58_g9381 [Xylaria curta]|uniref:Uncharacterized protein n=1 Tax=Xylaria curta TaxID=42375 RepID=A0ACC1MX36_9PEZI|nr:hypothetical protein NUW58_g9381 [Xylaria curta]